MNDLYEAAKKIDNPVKRARQLRDYHTKMADHHMREANKIASKEDNYAFSHIQAYDKHQLAANKYNATMVHHECSYHGDANKLEKSAADIGAKAQELSKDLGVSGRYKSEPKYGPAGSGQFPEGRQAQSALANKKYHAAMVKKHDAFVERNDTMSNSHNHAAMAHDHAAYKHGAIVDFHNGKLLWAGKKFGDIESKHAKKASDVANRMSTALSVKTKPITESVNEGTEPMLKELLTLLEGEDPLTEKFGGKYNTTREFALQSKTNVLKVKHALIDADIKFDISKANGMTYFFFSTNKDMSAARTIANKLVDKSKEEDWVKEDVSADETEHEDIEDLMKKYGILEAEATDSEDGEGPQ